MFLMSRGTLTIRQEKGVRMSAGRKEAGEDVFRKKGRELISLCVWLILSLSHICVALDKHGVGCLCSIAGLSSAMAKLFRLLYSYWLDEKLAWDVRWEVGPGSPSEILRWR
jgi:hypothetical protein